MKNSKIYLGVIGWICLLILGMSSVKAQTFNLNTIEPDSIPAGSILEWHNALPVDSGNLIANESAVRAGIYYAVYKKGTCYSNPSPFKIVKTHCGTDFTNLYNSVDTTDKPAGTILTFHTAKPVNVSNLYSGNAHIAPVGTYYAAFYDPVKGCFTMASPIRVIPNIVCGTHPDFNVTHVNVPVNGNVHTNDNVPAGSTYGTPVASSSNPATTLPVMNPDGTYTFTPTQTGVYTFYVPVCSPDTAISCVYEKLTITVANPFVSNPPIVNPDISIVDSGSIVTIPVLDNDQPGNPGGHFGPPVPSDPPNGTVTTTPEGGVVYTPDPGFTGVDSFTYTVCDTTANPDLCRSSTVTVFVNPGPFPNIILASDDFVKIPMNTMANGNVTSNDMDPNGDPMKVTAQNIYTPDVGAFVLDTSGNYSFTPDEDFFGSVHFPYTVCDTAGNCATATLYILVDPVNVLNPDFNITHLNTPVNGDISINDDAVPGTLYSTPIAAMGNPSTDLPQMQTDGTYTFTPTNTGVYVFNVPACPPAMTIDCPTETLTITVTNPYTPGGNNPPVVNPDISVVDSGSTVTVPVLDNDQPGNPGGHFGPPTTTDPPHGTVTTTPGGDIVYTPDTGFTGVDTFTYTVCDTTAVPSLCGTTTVTVHVNPPGAANTILANDDYINIKMNTTASGNVMNNDIDPDGDPIMVTAQNTTIGSGVFVVDAMGNYTFTPNEGFFGPVQVPYTVCDTAGNCTMATLHILVDPVNTLNPDFNVTHINVTVNGNMRTNDNLVEGSNFGTPVATTGNPSASVPQIQTNGTYTFTPTNTGVYVFNVPVCPPGVTIDCPMETLTITVTNPYTPGGNNPPVVNPDISVVDSGSTVTVPVLDNDQPGNPGGHFGPPTTTDPPHGTVTTTPGGDIVYTPDTGFTGVDTFTYTVCDTTVAPSACGTTTVTVHVNPPGAANTILANDDYVNIKMNTTASGNVMSNDIDPDGDPIMVTVQNTTTAAGTFVVDAMGNYTFTPATGTHGPVNMPYTVCDTAGNCTTATLHILIDPVNTLEPDFNVTNINTPVSGNLSTNDELVNGSTFGTPVANTGNPTTDLPTLNSNGSYSFTPDTAGVYTFYVPVCAPGQPAPCPTETLTITVLDPLIPVFPPVVTPDNATGMSNTPVTINITGNDDPTSPGGSFGTPGVTTPPSNGTVVVNTNGTVDYTPTPGFTGVDSFTYTICDTVPTPDQCGSATVTVNVLPPNAVNSVAANDDYVNTYGTVPATGNVLLNDNDPEGNTLTVTSQNVTTSQGTLVLSDNGQYTFTPVAGFTGTTSFTYTVCDNGTPQACDQATLHILVDKAPDYTPLVFGSNTLFSNNDTVRNFIVAIYNVNNTINKGPVKFRMSQSLPNKAFIIDPVMTTINYNGNAVAVSNANWNIVLNGSIYEFTLKPNTIIAPNGSMYIGFTVKVPGTAPYNQVQPVTANIIYQSGGDSNYSNNNYSITITKN